MSTAGDTNIPAGSIRRDTWWIQPLLTVIVLTAFVVYATWRTFENNYYMTDGSHAFLSGAVGDLLSPLYSPLIAVNWSIFGLHVSPALLILPFPLSFRLTCYYYRKAYYRSFFGKPPACAVQGTKSLWGKYTGEKYWPMAFQNLHRFAFYAAAIFIFILAYDVIKSTRFVDGWGVSVGTIVLLLNVIFLSCYTFGCHSWRHFIGGGIDCFSCSVMNKTRYGLWKKTTVLNENHQLWAWTSLFGVALTDLYIRLVTSGVLTDHVFFKVTNG